MTSRTFTFTVALPLLLVITGCASIISGRHAEVAIDSEPSNAHVVVHDKRGRQVASLHTPGVVALKRQGRFFMPARYTATIESPGYAPAHVPLRSTVNPWILGNVVVGGIPGLIVDNATGAAWKPKHAEIHQRLAALPGSQQGPVYSVVPQPQNGTAPATPYVADQSPPEASGHAKR